MITASALSSIEWLFDKSVRENSCVGPEDSCEVISQPDAGSMTKHLNRKLVVLNLSSYIFRIVALIEFNSDVSMVEHMAKIARSPDKKLEDQTLLDAYAEFLNMICGTVNRRLCAEFGHVGMSTPFFLDSACVSYLSILNPTAVKSFDFLINGLARFKLTACICVAKDKTLDFAIDQSDDPEAAASGELEFF
ncbi:MAG: hypothetical protein K8F27_11195 [Sulfuricellaceae bacterium]|nr:hypothetical protein [Sulfuricellaceae bacterium]